MLIINFECIHQFNGLRRKFTFHIGSCSCDICPDGQRIRKTRLDRSQRQRKCRFVETNFVGLLLVNERLKISANRKVGAADVKGIFKGLVKAVFKQPFSSNVRAVTLHGIVSNSNLQVDTKPPQSSFQNMRVDHSTLKSALDPQVRLGLVDQNNGIVCFCLL